MYQLSTTINMFQSTIRRSATYQGRKVQSIKSSLIMSYAMATKNNDMSSGLPTIDDVIEKIRSLGINFIAIDFDQTLIDKHTGGVYTGSLPDIIPHVRPIFIEFINAALQPSSSLNHDIHVAIVTYSKQPTLIRSILEHVFGIDKASKIIIRGNDKTWKYEGNGMKDGKQAHMASAVEEILHQHATIDSSANSGAGTGSSDLATAASPSTTTTTSAAATLTTTVEITRSTSLLIDDDERNIRIALKNGTRAIWYNPKLPPQQLYYQLAHLV